MDLALVSAAAALIGSLVGGVSTLVASWVMQRGQFRLQTLVHEAAKREALYAEFITEASLRLANAWGHQAESSEVAAGLYSALQRMRLTSSADVIGSAQEVIRVVLDAYARPDRTFDELRERLKSDNTHDRLKEFSVHCRAELDALRL
jgi:hypothetical protein